MNLDKLKIAMQYALPKHAVSRLVGKLAAAEAGALTTKLIKLFIKQYKIDMSEALHEDPAHYKTFNEFFTRPLKPGIRPLAEDSESLPTQLMVQSANLVMSSMVRLSKLRVTTTAYRRC